MSTALEKAVTDFEQRKKVIADTWPNGTPYHTLAQIQAKELLEDDIKKALQAIRSDESA